MRCLLVLIHDGEDDDDGGSQSGPREKPNFTPEIPAILAGLGFLLTGQEGVFFFDAAFVRGKSVLGEQRLLTSSHRDVSLVQRYHSTCKRHVAIKFFRGTNTTPYLMIGRCTLSLNEP